MKYKLAPIKESVDYLVANYTARELAIAYLKAAAARDSEIDDRLTKMEKA